jgi:ketosteroid isomerase-like protein
MLDRLHMQERFDCWNRDELEPMLAMYAADAVFDVSAVFTDVAPKRGHADMLGYWRELRQTWGGGMRTDPVQVLDVGDGRIVLEARLWGKGTRSGAAVDQRFAFLYEFGPDGLIRSAALHPDVAAAEAAAAATTAARASR